MFAKPGFTVPEGFNIAQALLDENVALGRGDRTAIYYENQALKYHDILEMTNRFGNGLRSLGVGIEDRVMMILKDSPEFIASFLGAIKIGAVPVPTSTMLTPNDYRYMLNLCRARTLVLNEEFVGSVEKVRPELQHLKTMIVVGAVKGDQVSFEEAVKRSSRDLEPVDTHKDDQAFWLWTSGTTGVPQAVVHLQHDIMFTIETYAKPILGITHNDRCFSASKLFFAYGLDNSLSYSLGFGASVVLYPERPKAEKVFAIIDRYRPTIFYAVPSLYNSMLQVKDAEHRFKLNSLRLCVSAGEALPAPIFHEWKKRFKVDILDGMGTSETLGMIFSNIPGQIRPGSSGLPVPGYEVKIVDDEGKEVQSGEMGYLMAKGDSTTPFYWLNHELTKQRIVGDWLYTGDIYRQDEAGFFWYLGRSSDMVKQGGIWVSPVEVEGVLLEHPAMRECAVVGVRDEAGLEKVKAFVVLKDSSQANESMVLELREFVRQRIAPFKAPKFVEFVDELPKTATGKVRRFMLRQSSMEPATARMTGPSADE